MAFTTPDAHYARVKISANVIRKGWCSTNLPNLIQPLKFAISKFAKIQSGPRIPSSNAG